jgi:hypothetical protein
VTKSGKHLSILAFLLLFGLEPLSAFQCHTIVQTCNDPLYTCIGIPTTLRPLSLLPNTDSGWNPGGACGTRSCMMLFRCPCGQYLSQSVCDSAVDVGGCDCGMGVPCMYSVGKLNEMLDPGKSVARLADDRVSGAGLYLPPGVRPELTTNHGAVLRRLQSLFMDLGSVEVTAAVWIRLAERTGDGTFEYSAAKESYRIVATAPPQLGLASGIEAAFDGAQHQLLYIDESRLSLSQADPGQIPSPYSNPFFLPVAFLSPEDDRCYGCELDLESATQAALWKARIAAARETDASGVTFLLPGGQLDGQPYYFRVTPVVKQDLIAKIEFVRANGRAFRRLDLSHYDTVSGSKSLFPRHLALLSLGDDGQVLAEIHFRITSLRANPQIDPKTFHIPLEKARIVIDEDRPSFVKHPQLELKKEPELQE